MRAGVHVTFVLRGKTFAIGDVIGCIGFLDRDTIKFATNRDHGTGSTGAENTDSAGDTVKAGKFFIGYVARYGFVAFGWYRIVVGALILILGACGYELTME